MALSFSVSAHSHIEKEISTKLMHESFGDVDISHIEYYDWQYLHNPVGKGTVLIVFDENVPVGQVASIPCNFRIGSQSARITLTMNVCVTPRYRGRGILTELMDRIHRVNDPVLFSVGIPNALSMKGHLKNGYCPIRMELLIRPIKISMYFRSFVISSILKPFDRIWKTEGSPQVKEISSFGKEFDNVDNLLSSYPIHQMRDSTFLNWRYINNPRRKYKIYATFDDNQILRGYIVITISEIFGRKVGLIMDFIAENHHSGKLLLRKAIEHLWQNDVAVVLTSSLMNNREFVILKKERFFACPDRFRPHPLSLCIKKIYIKDIEQLLINKHHWFFMFGDYETF